MTLSAQHLHLITDILGDENNNLEAIVTTLRQSVPNKPEHFALCSALSVLLSDNLLISPLQKVIAIYVIAALNPSPLVANPFFPVLATILEHPSSETWEVNYVASFLEGLPKDVRMLPRSYYLLRYDGSDGAHVGVGPKFATEILADFISLISSANY